MSSQYSARFKNLIDALELTAQRVAEKICFRKKGQILLSRRYVQTSVLYNVRSASIPRVSEFVRSLDL